jgi:hypothetical protein
MADFAHDSPDKPRSQYDASAKHLFEGVSRALCRNLSPHDSVDTIIGRLQALLDDPVRLGEYGLTLYQLARLRNLDTVVQDRLKRDPNMNILLPREEAIKLYIREEALNEGLTQGLKEGLTQGRDEERRQLVLKAYAKTRDAAAVADLLDLPLETVQAWVQEA